MPQTAQVRDVVSAVEATGGNVRVLGREEIAERWVATCNALGVNGAGPSTWLWEMVESTVGRPIRDAVTAIAEVGKLVGTRRCLVFFEDPVRPLWPGDPGYLKLSCVEVEGEASVTAALGETISEVFVADPDRAWVLMLNHHDCLVGAGDAKTWVQGMRGA